MFSLFGLMGVVYTVLVFPLIYLLPISLHSKCLYSKYIIHKSFSIFVFLMVLIGSVSLEIEGAELLLEGGQLIIANHPTLIDVVILIALVKRADCIIKKPLFRNPFTAGSVTSTGYISNDSDTILEDCKQSLESGNSLIIFPEGTRTQAEQVEFQRGAANMALHSGCDFTPVLIDCSPAFLDKKQYWYQYPKQKPHLRIKVLPRFEIAQYQSYEYGSIASRRLTQAIEQYFITQLLDFKN